MSWLRFQMNLTSEPSEQLDSSNLLEQSDSSNLSESFEPSEFPDFQPNVDLVEGRLAVMDDAIETRSFKATSGLQCFQYLKAQSLIGRGPIPACNKIQVEAYTVRTSPFDLSNESDADGNFYYIEPDPIDVDGVMRGEFGIHFDSDSPGSAGSIVLRDKDEWQNFKKLMSDYLGKGFPAINLIVEYSVQGKIINAPQLPGSGESVFTIESPKPGESRKVNEEINFSGTAMPQVSMIVVTVEPEKINELDESKLLFIVGEVEPKDGKWNFKQTLVNVGTRPFKFRALDEFSNLLQTVEFELVLV